MGFGLTLKERLRVVTVLACASIVLAWTGSVPAAEGGAEEADEQPSLGKALINGRLQASLRYRLEAVSDDAPAVAAHDAVASTLRSTLAYRTASWARFRMFAEFEDVTDVGFGDDHDNAGAGSLSNGVTDRPVIADPDSTEVNQIYLEYHRPDSVWLGLGRQEFARGDQRFVGPVGWRQNHQTFDAFRVRVDAIEGAEIHYAYVDNVNRIFGDNRPMSSHLLDAEIEVGKWGRLMPYVYWLDYDEPAVDLSTTTYGMSWSGKGASGGWRLPFHVEIARQADFADNPANVGAIYARLQLGASRDPLEFQVGWELLGGSPGDGRFTTPLATLHKFNGWADKFITTPTEGLRDAWVSVGVAIQRTSARLVVHDFRSDGAGLDYGWEIDAELKYTTSWKQSFALKLARYDADEFASDTEKIWLYTSYGF